MQLTEANNIQTDKNPLIVGIGASAGGLEALQQFFSICRETVA